MKTLVDYIFNSTDKSLPIDDTLETDFEPHDIVICEMALIKANVKLGKDLYDIYVHSSASKDRDYPHIHIYRSTDTSGTLFNFEVSLLHIVANDELVLVTQIDKEKHIERHNKSQTSWSGYRKLKKVLEDFLNQPNFRMRRYTYKNGLQACIAEYNSRGRTPNDFLKYCADHKIKILDKYKELIDDAADI